MTRDDNIVDRIETTRGGFRLRATLLGKQILIDVTDDDSERGVYLPIGEAAAFGRELFALAQRASQGDAR